ncbi:MAG: DUF2807 domain-containing protein [Rikenellaceae bacterium]
MNIITNIAVMIALLFTSCSSAMGANRIKKLKGDNNIVEQRVDLDLSNVRRIEASRAVDVTIVEANREEIVVRGNSNIMEYLDIRVNGTTLVATIDSRVNSLSNIDVELMIPYNGRYNSFKVSSSSEIESTETLRMESLKLNGSSAGEISLIAIVDGSCSIDASSAAEISLIAKIVGSCSVEASSASDVELTLSVDELSVDASSSSKVEAEGDCKRLEASASSSAKIDAGALEAKGGRLNASSLGAIIYRDMGGFSVSTSSAGSIKSVNN